MIDFKFENHSILPKYRQMMNTIVKMVNDGALQKGDKLPSCNELYNDFGISQDTVYKAYNELKKNGLVASKVGKGFFIQNNNIELGHNVFVFFDTLNAYKEELYDALKQGLKKRGTESIFFHHNNAKTFKTLLESAIGEYSEFVIMPIADKMAMEVLELLPKDKVYILDRATHEVKRKYSYICQSFEMDIYQILNDNKQALNQYKRVLLSIRHNNGHFKEIIRGFRSYCKKNSINHEVIFDTSNYEAQIGDLFIVVDDKDLITILKKVQNKGLEIGSEIGIISYNETPLKEVIANGITTISTDFTQMGKSMANLIITSAKQKIHNPFIILKRNSFK